MTEPEHLRVGQAAAAVGLTVRALHHYDEVGLVAPSTRTASGHRLYSPQDVGRLEQVAALRRSGLSLQEIAAALATGDVRQALATRLAAVELEITDASTLRDRLKTAIEEIDMIEDKLAARRAAVGDERIKQVEREWSELYAELDRHRLAGTDPSHPDVQALVAKGNALFGEFHGGDPALKQHATEAWERDPEETSRGMVNRELFDYHRAAMRYHG